MQSNITLVTIMASCAGFLLFFFVVAFLHFHEYLDYHCLRDRDFFSSKTLITILPSLHYQLHYHIALGLAIPNDEGEDDDDHDDDDDGNDHDDDMKMILTSAATPS